MEKSKVKTLQDLIIQASECYGEKTFIKEKHGNEIIEKSFSDLKDDSARLSNFLIEKTNSKVSHAAIIGTTSYNYLVCYFGTVNSGNVIVPLDAQLSVDDICDHLQRSDAEIFFYDKKFSSMLPQIKEQCPAVHTYVALQENSEEISIASILKSFNPIDWATLDPESCASILYTSGTTGKSKGVILLHRNLIDNTMCQDNESSPEDVILTVLPIHHVYCLTCDILLSLRYGTTVCINDSMMHIAQNLKRYQPTIILLVPMIAETIYKKIQATANSNNIPVSDVAKAVFGGKLKGIYSGGAYLNPKLANSYKEIGIPIAQGYGMTECSPRISTGTLQDNNDTAVGRLVNGCEVKIVDGEIWAKSPSVMKGYYKNPEATKESLTEDGWLRTGDLGYVDKDNWLYITGRKKNLIILSNGENVSPEELENKFSGIEFISEVLVYTEDEMITAEIFPNLEYFNEHPEENPNELYDSLIKKINATVSPAKAIRRLRVRDVEFDKTTSKKIKRKQTIQGSVYL